MEQIDEGTPFQFTAKELHALQALRDRISGNDPRFDAREQARLQFFRWLYGTGHFEPTEMVTTSACLAEEVAA